MKKLILNIVALGSITLISCSDNTLPKTSNHCGSYELNINGDTLNLIDPDCKKQGIWVIKGTNDTVYYKDGIAQIENAGVSINYNDSGQGDTTLLFVHGWCINNTYWKDQEAYFGKNYRVVSLDLGGFGKSGKNRKLWTVEEFGRDVSAVIRQLDLKHVILVGHSMSGAIVVEAALQNPGRVIGIVGIDNFKNIAEEQTPQSRAQVADVCKQARKDYEGVFVDYSKKYLFDASTDTAIINRVISDIRHTDHTISIDCIEQGDAYPLTQKLAASKRKIYLVNSDYTSTDTVGFKTKHIPYELHTIHATGHYPMVEKPKEFNALLEKAINSIKAGK